MAANHGAFASGQHGFVHKKLVWIHCALHHCFAQAIAGGDEHHLVKARFGVHGEHHACRSFVGAHHALNTSTQSHVGMGKAFVHTVGNGAVVIQ